jgi:predicted amidohydrolase YtcJ
MGGSMSRRDFVQGAAAGVATVTVPGAHARLGSRPPGPGRHKPADLVISRGRVLVMDRRLTEARAIALRKGRIVGVGSERQLRHLVGNKTELVDARGKTVLPGINDSHLHALGFGLSMPPFSYDVDTATIEELVARVQTAVAESSAPTAWVRGTDWNDNRLPRAPRRDDLDPVSGEHPVILTDFSNHAIAVNSRALELAGITAATAPPPGGVIEKYPAGDPREGEPTGVIRETAQALVRSVVPPFTEEERSRAMDTSFSVLAAEGITSLTDPGVQLADLALYESKHRDGLLPQRLSVLLAGGNSLETLNAILGAYQPLRDVNERRLRVAGVKLYADGIPTAAKTAWLHEPYLDGTNGSLVTTGSTDEEKVAVLQEQIRISHRAGFQIGVHATGDATIDVVVQGFLRAMRRHGRNRDPRHYVIHGDLTPPKTLRRMARNRIGVNMNATIKYLLGRTLDPIIGPERTDYQWPYRTALDAGVRVSSASDAGVTFPSFLQGVQSAVLREGKFGGVAGTAERIGVREALRTYTSTPAWQDLAEDWKGTLREGRIADVCVVGADVLDADPHALVDLPIDLTVVGGKVIYDGSVSGDRAVRRRAQLRAQFNDHAAVACYQAGKCCCKRNEEALAGLV